MGVRHRYEDHHKVQITDDAIVAAAELAGRYVTDRFLPDKAIDVIDEGAAKVKIRAGSVPEELRRVMREMEELIVKKDAAITDSDFERADELRAEEKVLRVKVEELETEWTEKRTANMPQVLEEDVATVVSVWTGIPVSRIAEEESKRLLHMEEELHQTVVSQDEAIDTISKAVRRARAGLKDPNRPIGTFILMGPTGVGKTHLARALADFMFGSQDALLRIDMSEYMERHSVSRLVGAPPGYVGYDEAGQLTEAVRRRPYSVILFDEIEKAHPDVFNILLQLMDDGRLTDAHGRTVDFRNTIVLMTSNIGAQLIKRDAQLGFQVGGDKEQNEENRYKTMKSKVLGELKKAFRPEFLNRIDATVVFRSLSRADMEIIVELELRRVRAQVTEHEMELEMTPEAVALLVEKGYDPDFGARPLKRVIQTMVEDSLAEHLLSGRFSPGEKIKVVRDGDELRAETREPVGA
jgi:ATP-dependent Clp protease ATP-binding subunit ClpC